MATAIPKFRAQPQLRGQAPCSLSHFLLPVCEGTGRSPQAAQLLRRVCMSVRVCGSLYVSACSVLCLGLCVFLRLCGLRVALGLSISFCSCVWVPRYVAVSLCISILASPQGSLSHLQPPASAPAPTTVPLSRGAWSRHPGGTHSSSPTASSPTRPGLSAGSDEAQSSRVARLSSSAQLPWIRVDLFSSSVEFSRGSMSWDFQCTLGLPGDPP